MTNLDSPRLLSRIWHLACGLLLALPAWGQQMPLRYFGQQEGLANLSVTTLAQDRPGYLWAGTENGLYRFDGHRFQQYGAAQGMDPTATVNDLLVDQAGRLWATTEVGLFVHEGTRFAPVLDVEGKPLPTSGGLHHMTEIPQAGILFTSGEQAFLASRAPGATIWTAHPYFSAEQLRARPDLARIGGVLAGRDGALWLTTRRERSRIYRIQQGAIEEFGPEQGLPEREYLGGITEDRIGSIWVRSPNKLLRLPSGGSRFEDRTGNLAPARILEVFFPLALDSDGRLLGATNEGLFRGKDAAWEVFARAEGLSTGGGINDILVDRNGEVWLALSGHGVAHWQGYRHWSNWTTAQGLPSDDTWSFLRHSDGSLLIGTGADIATLAPGARRFAHIEATSKEANGQVSALAEDHQGNVWAGTFSGHLMRRGADDGRIGPPMRLPMILSLTFDRRQRLLIGTTEGLYLLAGPEPAAQPRLVEALEKLAGKSSAYIRGACSTADGVLWFLADSTLLRLDGDNWSRVSIAGADSARPSTVTCGPQAVWLLEARSGRIWRGTPAPAGGTLQLTAVSTRPEHLKGRLIMSILADRRGWLWLGTDSGAAVWNGNRWRTFDQQSGMVWNDANQYALREDPLDGSIWIGTSNGASHVERPQDLFALAPVSVRVDAMRFNGQDQPPAKGMTLPWTGGALEFTLASLTFENRDALRYHYRLKGLEDEWSTTNSPLLRYAALPPGSYVLQVIASNAMLQNASLQLDLPFRVRPPWWRSTWFYALTILLAMAAISAAFRWRVRVVVRRQRELDQLVKARTAELEASREEHRLRAMLDGLTLAWNRGAMMERIAQRLASLELGGDTFVLVMVDLDYFKRINDTHGHLAGDAVLKEVVRRLQASLRAGDAVGRYGGEEFIVLLPDLDAERGRRRIEELHGLLAAAPVNVPDGPSIAITSSFGVAVAVAGRGQTPESLLKEADAALYRAKANGRNRVEYA